MQAEQRRDSAWQVEVEQDQVKSVLAHGREDFLLRGRFADVGCGPANLRDDGPQCITVKRMIVGDQDARVGASAALNVLTR